MNGMRLAVIFEGRIRRAKAGIFPVLPVSQPASLQSRRAGENLQG